MATLGDADVEFGVGANAQTFAAATGTDVLILGGGIAALAAASTLSAAGRKVTMVEAAPRCGGTHQSVNIGPYTFDYGSLFYEPGAGLLALADGISERCLEVRRQQRRVAPGGDLLHYPLEPQNLLKLPPLRLLANTIQMVFSRLLIKTDGTLDTVVRKYLGAGFYADTGIRNYVARFHHTSPKEVHENFFYQRMSFVIRFSKPSNLIKVAWRSLFGKASVSGKPRKPLLVRPREGFDRLFGPICERLQREGVAIHTETAVTRVERHGDGYLVRTDKGAFMAQDVVSTIPLDTVHRALFGEPSGLTSIDMITLFVSAEWLSPNAGNVLFNFHELGRWKRATIYSRIYPDNPTPREFMSVEVTLAPGQASDPQAAFADFRAHLEPLGLARDLKLEGHVHLENAYPLFELDCDDVYAAAQDRVAKTGVLCVGRQGRFEYLPTSSGVIGRTREELARSGLAEASPAVANSN